jgi:hypothetical protein
VSGYEVVTVAMSVVAAAHIAQTVSAACPAGKRVVGGGVELLNLGSTLVPIASFPSAADNTWRTTLRSAFITTQSVRVYAVCVAQ